MKNIINIFIAFAFFLNLNAQMLTLPGIRPQPQLIWNGGTLVVLEQMGTKLYIGNLDKGTFQRVDPPPNSLGISMWESNISAVRLINDQFSLSTRSNGMPWHESILEINSESSTRGFPMCLYESDRPGWYFGINVDTGFVKDGEASCCAWWRQTNSDRIVLDELIQIDLDAPAFIPIRINGRNAMATLASRTKGIAPFLDYPIRIPGAFVVVSWQAGILWTIKEGHSWPHRTKRLIELNEDLTSGKKKYLPVILGIQPMKNGHLLIAMRSSIVIADETKSNNLLTIETAQTIPTVPIGESTSIFSQPTNLLWKDYDPIEGTLTTPDDSLLSQLPSVLKSSQEVNKFRFGFDLSGRIISPWVSLEK